MRKIIMKHDKNSKKTFIFSKTIFCHKKISTLQNVTNRFYFRQKIQPESVSSTMTRVEMAKDFYLQMWIIFDI